MQLNVPEQAQHQTDAEVSRLKQQVEQLERRIGQIEAFLNKAFNTSIPNGMQYNQPNDRSETGMGGIVSADRSSFV